MFKRKTLHPLVKKRQGEADSALATSQKIAYEIDELEKEVASRVSRMRQLNRENNFTLRLEQAYRGAHS